MRRIQWHRWAKMRITGYKIELVFVVVGTIIGIASLLTTNYIARQLSDKEKNEIQLWAQAWNMKGQIDRRSQMEGEMILHIINYTTSIPAIITDDHLRLIYSQSIDQSKFSTPAKLRRLLERMANSDHKPIEIVSGNQVFIVFYDDSTLLKVIYFFPYIQLAVIFIFIGFAYITFRSSQNNEQNKVWIGMAKETAHQLGTPISSLMGWVEYLRGDSHNEMVTGEMSRDIDRLRKVADRFSKIGSSEQLTAGNLYESVANTVSYFRSRIPRNVTLEFDECCAEPHGVMLNGALFEWVMENLLKNALDALGGKGSIVVSVSCSGLWMVVDVTDTGRGIAKSNFNNIFRPGFTTKTRGWGLGLSLSKRIIEEYHFGRIFVKESEIDRGTTIRIMLKKI